MAQFLRHNWHWIENLRLDPLCKECIMKYRHLPVSALLLVSCSSVFASDYYLRAGLATNQSDTFTVTFSDVTGTAKIPGTAFEDATQLSLAVGRPMGDWRLELELFHQFAAAIERNGEVQVAAGGGGAFPVELYAEVGVTGLMANGYLNFATQADSRFQPYLSLGVGVTSLDTSQVSMSGAGEVVGMQSDDVADLAWRAGIGISWLQQSGAVVDLGVSRYDYGTAESGKSGFSTGTGAPLTLTEPFAFDVSGLSWGLSIRRPL